MEERSLVLEKLRKKFNTNDIEILNKIVREEAPEDAGRLWYLCRAIQDLDKVEKIYFVNGYENANGCNVEKYICELYGLDVIKDE